MRKALYSFSIKLPTPLRKRLKVIFPKMAQRVLQNTDHLNRNIQKDESNLSRVILKALIFNSMTDHAPTLKPKMAFFSPWMPSKSGIAWHASKVVFELLKYFSVDVFVSNMDPDWLPETGVFPISFFEVMNIKHHYNFRLFNLGNGPDHAESLQILENLSGSVILHDVRISAVPSNYSIHPTTWRNGPYGDLGLYRLPLDAQVFVHSEHAKEMVLSDRYGKHLNVNVLGNGLPVDVVGKVRKSPPVVLGSAGFVSPVKSPELIAVAFGLLARSDIDLQFRFIGSCTVEYESSLTAIFNRASRDTGTLRFIKDLDESEYWVEVEKLDLAVQLRVSTNGESSGTAIEIQSRGIPVVCTDIGSNRELPAEIFVKVRKDISPTQLAQNLRVLIADLKQYEQRSAAGVKWAKNRIFSNYALELRDKLEEMPISTERSIRDA